MRKLFALSIAVFVIACTNRDADSAKPVKRKVKKECAALSDSAMSILNKYYSDSDSAKLDAVLILLNKALECDTSFFLAFNIKISVLSLQGKYAEAIEAINKMTLHSKDKLNTDIIKACLFLKSGNGDSAKILYSQVEKEYNRRLTLYPDSIDIVADKIYFFVFMGEKEEAQEELNKYFKKYPNNKRLIEYQSIIEIFDKDEFVRSVGKLPE